MHIHASHAPAHQYSILDLFYHDTYMYLLPCLADMFKWLSTKKTNANAVARIVRDKTLRSRAVAEQVKHELEQKQLFKQFVHEHAPLLELKRTNLFCESIVNGIISDACDSALANNKQANKRHVVTSNKQSVLNINVNIQINTVAEPPQTKSKLNGHARESLSWLERSALIWLYLCPRIFPHSMGIERFQKVALVGGCHYGVVKKWLCRREVNARKYTPKWFNIVQNMTWRDVKKFFPRRWVSKQAPMADDTHVRQQMQPWHVFTEGATVSLSKFISATRSGAKRAGLAKKRPTEFENINVSTKRSRRSDVGKARSFPDIADRVEEHVTIRWNSGDPCTRRCVCPCIYNILMCNDVVHCIR